MKILYQESDAAFRSYVSMVLETAFDAEIVEVSYDQEGIMLMEFEDPASFDLIISDFTQANDDESLFVFLKKTIPNLPYVFLIDPDKNDSPKLKEFLVSHDATIKINKPFKDTEFFPVVEKLLDDYSESKGSNPESSSSSTEDDFSASKNPVIADDESVAGNNTHIKKKKAPATMEADWSIEKKKGPGGEVEADWSVEKKKKDYGDKEFADWSLAKDKNTGEVEADWEIEKKEYHKGAEEEADWSLAKDERGEEEADWEYKKKGNHKGEEEELDYGLGKENPALAEDEEVEGSFEQELEAGEAQSTQEVEEEKSWVDQKREEAEEVEKSAKEKAQAAIAEYGEYVPVEIEIFFELNDVCCDVYLKLSKTKYLKVINAKDIYDHDQIKRYSEKGKKELFIKGDDAEEFYIYMERINLGKLNKDISEQDIAGIEITKLDHIYKKIKKLGVTDEVIEETDKVVKSCLAHLQDQSEVFDTLQSFIKKENYLAEHSILNAYVCNQMLKKMNWSNDTTIQKITIASLFHDLALTDDYLAFVSDLDDENYPLTDAMKQQILAHPTDSANLVNKMKNVIPDVDTIIHQHHEKPDGSGFPKGLSAAEIQPLACILIISEDFVNRIYDNDFETINIDEIKEDFQHLYSKGNFKKVLDAFLLSF